MSKANQKQSYVTLPPDRDPKFLGLFTRDRSFYKTLFPLLLVVVLQQLAALAVNMVDNLMLGRYTELALSGATLVNQIQFVLQQVAMGIGMGIVVLASQYWGQRRTGPIKKIISLGMKVGLLIGLIFFAVCALFPNQVLTIFTSDAAVLAEGVKYLKIICWTYILFALSNSLMYALQSIETAMIGTIMSCSTIVINLFLNYILIYGHFGAPELGIRGAAIATLISRSVELVIIVVYILFIDKKLHMKLWELLQFDFTYLKDFLKRSTPMVITGFLWGISQAVQTAVLGHINSTVIAANSIAVTIFLIFAVFSSASANTLSIVVAKTVGEGKYDKIRSYSKTLQAILVILGIITALLLFVVKDGIVGAYNISPETRALAIQFLIVLSITSIGTTYEYPVSYGIIAGGGTTSYAALVDNLFMWIFTIPSAILSAFFFKWPPLVTFCFLKADQLLKCIPNGIVCNRYRWVRVLTRPDADSDQA